MLELYLVRHGHTVVADAAKIAGFSDVALSKMGEFGISSLLDSMSDLAIDQYHSSDLHRAVRSAELLNAERLFQDRRLRELNFGDWEGLTWYEVRDRDPKGLSRWSENWVDNAPPNGESFAQLSARCEEWLNDLHSINDDAVMVTVAHGGSIRALLCTALGLPLSSAFKFSIDFARVTKLTLTSAGHRYDFINGISFWG